jgi:hypothetical protein
VKHVKRFSDTEVLLGLETGTFLFAHLTSWTWLIFVERYWGNPISKLFSGQFVDILEVQMR